MKQISKKISVIVPVYNCEKYIEQCLLSIINQTHKNLEVVVINDGSTDNSLKIISSIAAKDDRIKVHAHKKLGLSVARNRGLAHATGDFISFIDADDYVQLDMFEKMLEPTKARDVDIVCCTFNAVNEDGRYIKSYKISNKSFEIDIQRDGHVYYNMYIDGPFGIYNVTNKLFNRRLIVENSVLFNPARNIGEDFEFSLDFAQYANKFVFLPESLYNYRITPNSLTRGYTKNVLQQHVDWLETLNRYVPQIASYEDSLLKMRRLSAQNLLFALYQEALYYPDTNLSDYVDKALQIEAYQIAYQSITTEMLTNRGDRILWSLLKAKRYKLLKSALVSKGHLVNFRNKFLS